jgi:hypothetical protein
MAGKIEGNFCRLSFCLKYGIKATPSFWVKSKQGPRQRPEAGSGFFTHSGRYAIGGYRRTRLQLTKTGGAGELLFWNKDRLNKTNTNFNYGAVLPPELAALRELAGSLRLRKLSRSTGG